MITVKIERSKALSTSFITENSAVSCRSYITVLRHNGFFHLRCSLTPRFWFKYVVETISDTA